MQSIRNNRNGRLRFLTICFSLYYEAYEEMATKVMQDIVGSALAVTGVEKCYLVHRVGTVQVGQPSIIVACSSKHRRDAHATVLHILDQVKAKAPIWKRPCWGDTAGNWSDKSEAFWLADKSQ